MTLSTEKIIYELTRIKINLKCYQEIMSDSSKKIDKLISHLKPSSTKKRKRPDSDNPNEKSSSLSSGKVEMRNESSFGSEVGDIVASLNCNNHVKVNAIKLLQTTNKKEPSIAILNKSREWLPNLVNEQTENNNGTGEIKDEKEINRNINLTIKEEKEKDFKLVSILGETKHQENFQYSPIQNHSKSNEPTNKILVRFNSAVKRVRRIINSPSRENQESSRVILPRTDNKENKNNGIDESPGPAKLKIFFCPRELFDNRAENNKINKNRLSTLGKLDLSYNQCKEIEIKSINKTFRNKSHALPHYENACTIQLFLKSENTHKHMSGMAFEIHQTTKILNDNPTSQIVEINEISSEYLNKYPDKKYLFLVFKNKTQLFNFSKMSMSEWEDFLLNSLIEKNTNCYYPVLIKDLVLFQLTAELKSFSILGEVNNIFKEKKDEGSFNSLCPNLDITHNKSIINFGTEKPPFPRNLTINNNTFTNNISSAGPLCLNPNPKEILNIFKDNPGNQLNENLWNNNNINKHNNQNYGNLNSSNNNFRNLNNINIPQQIQLGFSNNHNNQNISNFNWPSNNNQNNFIPNSEKRISIFNKNENFKNLHINNLNPNSDLINSTINDDYDNNMKWDRNF